jgi:hypothetical protein
MQDRTSSQLDESSLATRGRTIHWGQNRKALNEHMSSGFYVVPLLNLCGHLAVARRQTKKRKTIRLIGFPVLNALDYEPMVANR